MFKTTMICAAALLAGTLASCLKEKECPRKAAVTVSVEDTDYDNAEEFSRIAQRAVNPPMSDHVETLDIRYIMLPDTKPTVYQELTPGAGDRSATLATNELPAGNYQISVTGNSEEGTYPNGTEYIVELHPEGSESSDLYLGRDTLDLPPAADRNIALRRTKGKLLILYEKFPENIARVEMTAAGISKYLDETLVYTGTTDVAKSFLLDAGHPSGQLETILAPTQAEASPQLSLALYDSAGNPKITFSRISLTMLRNHISAVKVHYDEPNWEIWITANGQWVQLHDLTID